jgi:outer membrane receptor protein involved in Fe transport
MGQLIRFAVAVMIVSVCVATVRAQDNIVLFGGYSYLRPPVTAEVGVSSSTTTNNQSMNGWELSGAYRLLPFLGLRADFSGNYGTAISSGTSSASQELFLFGPEVSFPARVSPFAHVLVGGTHIGGGIDIKVIPHVWVRPIQIDYVITRLNGATQNVPRVSAGLVIHL